MATPVKPRFNLLSADRRAILNWASKCKKGLSGQAKARRHKEKDRITIAVACPPSRAAQARRAGVARIGFRKAVV